MILNKEKSMQSFSDKTVIESDNFYFLNLQGLECEETLVQQNYETFKMAQADINALCDLINASTRIKGMIVASDVTDGTKLAATLDLVKLDQLVDSFNKRFGSLLPMTVTIAYYNAQFFRLKCESYSYFEINSGSNFLLRHKNIITAYIRPDKSINPSHFTSIHLRSEQPSTSGLFAPRTPDAMQGFSNNTAGMSYSRGGSV